MESKIKYINDNVTFLTLEQRQNIANVIHNHDEEIVHSHCDGVRVSYSDMSPELIEIIYNIIYNIIKR